MPDETLETLRVTAERVHRFADAVEEDPSDENRELWRAALRDLRDSIRDARAAGHDTAAIQEAAGPAPTGRFPQQPSGRQRTGPTSAAA